jgi:hypothetical protein
MNCWYLNNEAVSDKFEDDVKVKGEFGENDSIVAADALCKLTAFEE